MSAADCQMLAPFRGPSGYQARSQYYTVLNHFFSDGVHVRRYACFKRQGDKQGWGAPEYREGLELDRSRFLNDWKLSQAGARLAELAADGCEIVSYKKHPAPGGMVTYLLVSWPTNRDLEKNRSARVLHKQPKQSPLPREITPFRRSQPHHVAEVAGKDKPINRHENARWFEQTLGAPNLPSRPQRKLLTCRCSTKTGASREALSSSLSLRFDVYASMLHLWCASVSALH